MNDDFLDKRLNERIADNSLRKMLVVKNKIDFCSNEEVKEIARQLQLYNLDVRPILYPSVPKGAERLRIIIHSFNRKKEIMKLCNCLNSSL